MENEEFDLLVIGTGSGGKKVAYAAAKQGKKVAITDNREYGGTCANRGCDPKKVLVGLTEIIKEAENLKGKGIATLPTLNWQDLMHFKKEKFTDPVPFVHERNLKKAGIHTFHGSPQFIGENELVLDGVTIKADKIVIATGQKAADLKIPGGEKALISDVFLSLEKLPQSMIFIGGGYIGMELAHIAARMGVKVTLIHSHERPLGKFDPDIVDYLVSASKELGIEFVFNARANRINGTRGEYTVVADQKGNGEVKENAEMVINATGRIPSIAELNLDHGKVAYSKKGISVNEKLQSTSNPNVYACGDVADSFGLPLSPLAPYEAEVVISQLFSSEKKTAEYPLQPSVVFTLPNVAKVGLLETEAKENGMDIDVQQKDAGKWYNAKRTNAKTYASKVLLEKESQKIVGAHIVGPEAAEMINLFTLAMNQEMAASDLKKMIFAYPTWGGDIQSMV